VDPDCGLKTRTVEESIEKLRVCVAAAKAYRN
jgi:methionine synthase II (cobalamin-independent)